MYRISVLVGCEFFADGTKIPFDTFEAAITQIEAYAIDRFAGFTSSPNRGGWKSGEKSITEYGRTFVILCESPISFNQDASEATHMRYIQEEATAFATFVRSALQQKSVVLTVDKVDFARFIT